MEQAHPEAKPETDFSKALFTQSDWAGAVCRESWFGRHAPYGRMFGFIILSSWCWTLSTLYSLYVFQNSDIEIPIVKARTREEINEIKFSHQKCFQSLCDDIGRQVEIDCIVNDDGVSSRVEYGEDVPDYIYFPEACHQATETTFGARYLDDEARMGAVAFIALQKEKLNNETATSGRVTSLLTLLTDCSVMVSDPEMSPEELQAIREQLNIGGSDWDNLYKEFNNQQQQRPELDIAISIDLMNPSRSKQLSPGQRENLVLKSILCMDEMPEDIQQHVIPSLTVLYNFLMDYRQEILTVLLYASNFCFSIMTLGWLMVRLIFPALVMKRVLFWPEGIRTFDIWRMLLLLCFTTGYRLMSPALTLALAVGAVRHKNFTAAVEWSFLGVLAWAAPDIIYPFLNYHLAAHLARLDALNILYYLLHLFVIGEGWWKCVTVYVVYRAYQSLYDSVKPQPIDQTQMHLDGTNTVNGEEHIKMD